MTIEEALHQIVESTLETARVLAASSVPRKAEIRRQIAIAQLGMDAIYTGEDEPEGLLTTQVMDDYDGDVKQWYNDNHDKKI